jgi:hypothetical protein
LPEWWNPECEKDPRLLPELEIRLARFLDAPLSLIQDPSQPLAAPTYAKARLRRVRGIEPERMAPAVHFALKVGEAVVRSMHSPAPGAGDLPTSATEWHQELGAKGNAVTLTDILADLWGRGVPVVPLGHIPAPSFQGMVGIVEGRPVIFLGHRHDEPGRVAFVVVHEAGHIAAGDCTAEGPIVDGDDATEDLSDIEKAADDFALKVLVGSHQLEPRGAEGFKALARQAIELETSTGAEASNLIFGWARKTGDYATATRAVQALYRATGAWATLASFFRDNVDRDAARETDRELLNYVHGGPLEG